MNSAAQLTGGLPDTQMSAYFAGERLYGDDFSPDAIRRWFDTERVFGGPVFNSRIAVIDPVLSRLFSFNGPYHSIGFFEKLQPTAVAFVLQKPASQGSEVNRSVHSV
jgi:hypothetical protein